MRNSGIYVPGADFQVGHSCQAEYPRRRLRCPKNYKAIRSVRVMAVKLMPGEIVVFRQNHLMPGKRERNGYIFRLEATLPFPWIPPAILPASRWTDRKLLLIPKQVSEA